MAASAAGANIAPAVLSTENFWEVVRSGEGGDSGRLIIENLKQVQNANQAQGLDGELGGVNQLDGPTTLLGRGHALDQNANPAGIDHRHFREVDYDLRVPG